MPCIARSSFAPNRRRSGCEIVCGGLPGSPSCRTIGTSSRRDAGFADADFRTTRGPAARERLWGESFSGCLFMQVFEEGLLLFARQELVVARDRVEKDRRVAIVQVRAREESVQIIAQQQRRDLSVPIRTPVSITCSKTGI